MKVNAKIAPYQIFIALFLCRIFSSIIFIPESQPNLTAAIKILSIIISAVIVILLFLPILWLLNQNSNADLCDISIVQFGKAGKLISLIYAVYFLFVAINSLAYCGYFIKSSVFPNANVFIIEGMLLIAVIYGVIIGIESIMRFSFIAFFFIVISLIVIMCAVIPKGDMANIKLVGDNMISELIKSVNLNIQQSSELVILPVIAAFSYKKINKGFFLFETGTSLFFAALAFIMVSVLGSFINTQIFPVYTLSTMANIPVIDRFDALHISIWIIMGIIKASIYIFSANYILKKIFLHLNKNALLIFVSAAVFAAAVLINYNLKAIMLLPSVQYTIMAVTILGFIYPISCALVYKIKKGNKKI